MLVKVTGSETTHEDYHDGEQYGSWYRYSHASIESVTVAEEDDKRHYDSEYFKVLDGSTTIFVLWMSYSSGDSFGHSSGNLDILHAFGDEEAAKRAFKEFQDKSKEYSIKINDDFGTEISLYNNGSGYFESIESLNLEPFSISGASLKWNPNDYD